MNTIVFVEDDAEVGSLIAAYLAKHDMQVTVEPRGDQAEETILRESPDLVLLDIMLPGKDGMTICRDLRAKWSGPIVLLTFLDSDMNHILALEMGACDYILKTTPPAVLLARLRLHLRQNEQATLTKGLQETSLTPYKALHFGTLTIDPINRVVTLANTEISLSTADFELLWELATHAGQIMDRDALLKNLRGVSYDGLDRSVDVAISRLRKKLLDNAADIAGVASFPPFIYSTTVRKIAAARPLSVCLACCVTRSITFRKQRWSVIFSTSINSRPRSSISSRLNQNSPPRHVLNGCIVICRG